MKKEYIQRHMSNVFTDIDNTELKMDENEKKKELMKNSNIIDGVTATNVALDSIQGHAVDMFMKNSGGGITKVDGLNVTPEFAAIANKLFKGHDDTDINVQALMMMTEIWTPPAEDNKTSADTETDIGVYKGDTGTSTGTNTDTAENMNDVTDIDKQEVPSNKATAKKVTSKKDSTGKLPKKQKKETSKEQKKQKKNVTFTASFGDITFSADF